MNKIFSKIKEESGQALVIVAASLVLIFGATALSVDLGMAYNAKAELQAAADAAALAAAADIPNKTNVATSVYKYAELNGVDADHVSYQYPYVDEDNISHSDQIEVTCWQTFDYLFAKVLGFESKLIEVRAVAEKRLVWGGETLPFINIDDPYNTGQPIVLWEKVGYGDFEQLFDNNRHEEYEFTYDGAKKPSAIKCMLNGLTDEHIDIRQGEKAAIDAEVSQLCDLWAQGEFVYVLSLEEIPTNPVNYVPPNINIENGKKVSASISVDNIVLLKCTIGPVILTGSANDRGITLNIVPGSTPIRLGQALRDKTYIPGFDNSSFRVSLVE